MSVEPLASQRFSLSYKAVLLKCLDREQRPLPKTGASGFIRREKSDFFLYTCWHVVSGYGSSNDIRVGLDTSPRRYLRIALQGAEQRTAHVQAIGGLQTTTILPLYADASASILRPLWMQDDAHVPHPDLNQIGLHVPFWHDIVKLKLPSDLAISDMQLIDENRLSKSLPSVGDKCFVVGYPYGFSVMGSNQPTPVVLTRFIASSTLADRLWELLLEGIGAPTMSGGPVFVERGEEIQLLGAYTGLIYPDCTQETNEPTTALGTIVNLSAVFMGQLPLVETPSKPTPRTRANASSDTEATR